MVTFCVCFLFFFLYFSKRHKSTKGEHRNINAGLNGLQPRTRWVKGGASKMDGGGLQWSGLNGMGMGMGMVSPNDYKWHCIWFGTRCLNVPAFASQFWRQSVFLFRVRERSVDGAMFGLMTALCFCGPRMLQLSERCGQEFIGDGWDNDTLLSIVSFDRSSARYAYFE